MFEGIHLFFSEESTRIVEPKFPTSIIPIINIFKSLLSFIIFFEINLFFIPYGFCSAKSFLVEFLQQSLNSNKDILIVDVRNQDEFKKYHIPGSPDVPLFALKAKTFLISKPIALVNNGHNLQSLT
jgi:hypothetical protein